MEDKVPMPPPTPLFVPVNFWLDVIAYMDKKTELICNNSGYGTLTMTIKIHKSRIHEVDFKEEIKVRDIIKKAGAIGSVPSSNEKEPVTDAE